MVPSPERTMTTVFIVSVICVRLVGGILGVVQEGGT
jgi:hypothetical protein